MDAETRHEVERAMAGDRTAFESLIRKYGRLAYARAYSLLQRREDAEDAVQEAFLKAYQKRTSLKDPEKFPGWLLSIAKNRALDAIRKRPWEPPVPKDGPSQPERWRGPEALAQDGETRAKVLSAVASLPEPHRLAVTLRYLEDMPCKEIEKALSMTNGALRGILGRSLHSLRKALAPAFRPGEG